MAACSVISVSTRDRVLLVLVAIAVSRVEFFDMGYWKGTNSVTINRAFCAQKAFQTMNFCFFLFFAKPA